LNYGANIYQEGKMALSEPSYNNFKWRDCIAQSANHQHADRGLPVPDIVLYMNLPREVAAKRPGFGKEVFEKEEMQQEVQRLFAEISKDVPEWREVDANRDIEVIRREVFQIAMKLAKEKAEEGEDVNQMKKLWLE